MTTTPDLTEEISKLKNADLSDKASLYPVLLQKLSDLKKNFINLQDQDIENLLYEISSDLENNNDKTVIAELLLLNLKNIVKEEKDTKGVFSDEQKIRILKSVFSLIKLPQDEKILILAIQHIEGSLSNAALTDNMIEDILNRLLEIIKKLEPDSIYIPACILIQKLFKAHEDKIEAFMQIVPRLIFMPLSHSSAKVREVAEKTLNAFPKLLLYSDSGPGSAVVLQLVKESYCKDLVQLMKDKQELYVLKIWPHIVNTLGKQLHLHLATVTPLFQVIERGFKSTSDDVCKASFIAWKSLISNFALDEKVINDSKKLRFILKPFKNISKNNEGISVAVCDTWWHLNWSLSQNLSSRFTEVCVPLLEFTIGKISAGADKGGLKGHHISLAKKGCHILLRLLEQPPNAAVSRLTSPKKIQSLSFLSLQEPLDLKVIVRHFKDIIPMVRIVIEVFGTAKEMLGHIDTLMKSILFILSAVIDEQSKESLEASILTINLISDMTESKICPSSTCLKCIDSLSKLPSTALASHCFNLGPRKPQDILCTTLLKLMLNPYILSNETKNKRFPLAYNRLIQAGICGSLNPLLMTEKYINILKSSVSALNIDPEILLEAWSGIASPLLEAIESTQEVNQGDKLEHDFSCLYDVLLCSFEPSVLVFMFHLQRSKPAFQLWINLFKTFVRCAALVTTTSPNEICEHFCSRVKTNLTNDVLKEPRYFEALCYLVQTVLESVDFTSVSLQGQNIANALLGKIKKPIGNLTALVDLLSVLLNSFYENYIDVEEDIYQSCTPKAQKKGNILKSALPIDLSKMFFQSLKSGSVIQFTLQELAQPLSKLFGAYQKNVISTKLEMMFNVLATSVEMYYLGPYDSDFLTIIGPLLETTFCHPRRHIKERSRRFWFATFAPVSSNLKFPETLKNALKKSKISLIPDDTISPMEDYEFPPDTECFEDNGNNFETAPVVKNRISKGSEKPTTKKTEMLPPKPSIVKNLDELSSSEFVKIEAINSVPAKRRSVRVRRSFVPALYNDLSQSQDFATAGCSSQSLDAGSSCEIIEFKSQSQEDEKELPSEDKKSIHPHIPISTSEDCETEKERSKTPSNLETKNDYSKRNVCGNSEVELEILHEKVIKEIIPQQEIEVEVIEIEDTQNTVSNDKTEWCHAKEDVVHTTDDTSSKITLRKKVTKNGEKMLFHAHQKKIQATGLTVSVPQDKLTAKESFSNELFIEEVKIFDIDKKVNAPDSSVTDINTIEKTPNFDEIISQPKNNIGDKKPARRSARKSLPSKKKNVPLSLSSRKSLPLCCDHKNVQEQVINNATDSDEIIPSSQSSHECESYRNILDSEVSKGQHVPVIHNINFTDTKINRVSIEQTSHPRNCTEIVLEDRVLYGINECPESPVDMLESNITESPTTMPLKSSENLLNSDELVKNDSQDIKSIFNEVLNTGDAKIYNAVVENTPSFCDHVFSVQNVENVLLAEVQDNAKFASLEKDPSGEEFKSSGTVDKVLITTKVDPINSIRSLTRNGGKKTSANQQKGVGKPKKRKSKSSTIGNKKAKLLNSEILPESSPPDEDEIKICFNSLIDTNKHEHVSNLDEDEIKTSFDNLIDTQTHVSNLDEKDSSVIADINCVLSDIQKKLESHASTNMSEEFNVNVDTVKENEIISVGNASSMNILNFDEKITNAQNDAMQNIELSLPLENSPVVSVPSKSELAKLENKTQQAEQELQTNENASPNLKVEMLPFDFHSVSTSHSLEQQIDTTSKVFLPEKSELQDKSEQIKIEPELGIFKNENSTSELIHINLSSDMCDDKESNICVSDEGALTESEVVDDSLGLSDSENSFRNDERKLEHDQFCEDEVPETLPLEEIENSVQLSSNADISLNTNNFFSAQPDSESFLIKSEIYSQDGENSLPISMQGKVICETDFTSNVSHADESETDLQRNKDLFLTVWDKCIEELADDIVSKVVALTESEVVDDSLGLSDSENIFFTTQPEKSEEQIISVQCIDEADSENHIPVPVSTNQDFSSTSSLSSEEKEALNNSMQNNSNTKRKVRCPVRSPFNLRNKSEILVKPHSSTKPEAPKRIKPTKVQVKAKNYDEVTNVNTRFNANMSTHTRRLSLLSYSPSTSAAIPFNLPDEENVKEEDACCSNLPNSILKKRKATYDVPVAKMRKVTFATPMVKGCLFKKDENTSQISKHPVLVDIEHEDAMEEPDTQGNEMKMEEDSTADEIPSSSEYQSSDILMDTNHPVSPMLINCSESVSTILKNLTSATWVRGLESLLAAKNIQTIGDLCKLNVHELKALPIKSPKLESLHQALVNHFLRSHEVVLHQLQADESGGKDSVIGGKVEDCTESDTLNSLAEELLQNENMQKLSTPIVVALQQKFALEMSRRLLENS